MAEDPGSREYDYGVFDAINILTVRLDLSGCVVYMNRKARIALGYGEDDPAGVDWFAVHVAPAAREAARGDYLAIASGAGTGAMERAAAVVSRTGGNLGLQWQRVPMTSEGGRPIGALYFARGDEKPSENEKRLALHDLYFDAIVSSIADALIILDKDKRIRYLNPVAEELTGLHPAECEGRLIDGLLVTKDAKTGIPRKSSVVQAVESGVIQRSGEEIILACPNGREFYIDGSVAPVIGTDGEIRGAVVVFRDVTEKRRDQESLRDNQVRLQSILAAMPLGIHQYRLDDSGDLVFIGANKAADEILALDHAPLVGRKILEAFPDLARTDIPAIYRRIAEGGPPVRKEEVAYKDERIVGAFEVNAFNTGEGRMAAVFNDILERKKAEIDRDRFFEISDDLILQGTVDGRFFDVNSAATRILGWTREEFLSHPWTYFIHPEDLPGSEEGMKELAKGNRVVKTENRHRHKDGRYRWLSWASMYIPEEKKVISIARDVTEDKLRFEEQKQKDKLEAIGRLAGGVAHDFNNQLAGIMGCAEILQARLPPDSELQKFIGLIIDSARTSADLAGQLLAFARKGNYQMQAVDLNAVVEGARSILSLTINRKISVVAEPSAEPAMIEGDLSQIQNAVMNLGINARDAMPNGGTLTFRVEAVELDEAFLRANPCGAGPGKFVSVSVGDTGVGMDSETRGHLFEPFFSTKAEGRGTGLGLAAVYGIVKSHRGTVTVDTAEGKGSVFRLYFPSLGTVEREGDRPDGGNPAPAPAEPPAEKEGAMILVVDDENVICLMAQAMLGMFGYETAIARTGKEALEYLAARPFPDLILLDMMMPDLSGEEVFERIREMNPRARVIISSGYSIDGMAQTLLDRGAVGFIQKPYRKDALQAAVKEALEKA